MKCSSGAVLCDAIFILLLCKFQSMLLLSQGKFAAKVRDAIISDCAVVLPLLFCNMFTWH